MVPFRNIHKQMILGLLPDTLLLLMRPHYPVNVTIRPRISPEHLSLPEWHLLCIINISAHSGLRRSLVSSVRCISVSNLSAWQEGWSLSPFSVRRRWNDIWAPCQMWVHSPLMRRCQDWSLLFQPLVRKQEGGYRKLTPFLFFCCVKASPAFALAVQIWLEGL